MLNLDFAFLTPEVVSGYVLKGFVFSLQLTLIAMVGGIVLGTLLALMRLSSKPWLVMPAAGSVSQGLLERRISARTVPSAMPPSMAMKVSCSEKTKPFST